MPAVYDSQRLDRLGRPEIRFITAEEYAANPGEFELVDPEQSVNIETGIDTAAVRAADIDPLTQRSTDVGTEAQIAKTAGQESQVGGLGGQITAGLEGAADALTLGGYSAARVALGDEETREDLADRAELYSGTRAVGQIAGELASFGLGAAKTGALRGIASLAPGARASRTAGRIAEGGLSRRLAAGAYDAALQGAGTAIAEEAMSERPWSSEAIASRAITSGLLGAGATGVLDLAGKGLGKLGRSLDDRATRSLVAQADDDAASALARQADEIMGKPSDRISWRQIYTKGEVDRNAVTRQGRKTVAKIAESADRAPAVREFLDQADTTLGNQAATAEARAQLAEFETAANAARKWAEPLGTKAKGKARRSLARHLTDDPDEAISVLTRFDEASAKLEDAVTSIRQQIDPSIAAREIDTTAPGLQGLVNRGRKALQGRRAEQALDVVAGAELAAEATGYRPSDLLPKGGFIGEATSAYLKLRALRSAFARRGFFPKSKAAQAAADSASVGTRIQDAVSRAAHGAGRALQRPGVARAAKIVGKNLDTALRELREPEDLTIRGHEATQGLPEQIATGIRTVLETAQEYLAASRPVIPAADTPFADPDLVSPSAVRDYEWRKHAVYHPDEAIEDLLALDHPRPALAVEAIRAVYPQMYAMVQAELLEQLDSLAKRPEAIRNQLGALWDVPLTRAQVSQSRNPTPPAPPPDPEQPPAPPQPSANISTSATVSALETRQQQRGNR